MTPLDLFDESLCVLNKTLRKFTWRFYYQIFPTTTCPNPRLYFTWMQSMFLLISFFFLRHKWILRQSLTSYKSPFLAPSKSSRESPVNVRQNCGVWSLNFLAFGETFLKFSPCGIFRRFSALHSKRFNRLPGFLYPQNSCWHIRCLESQIIPIQ